ncbi:MAG: HAMP domain-containing histidine kinase [Myxococcota bacterium]|nr:HAMP domain-containing histidine kinase [Myxococcota bacterium]MDW8363966.1 HAMP domain-containing sensor histidine kinase [Myxococcales bacterium]
MHASWLGLRGRIVLALSIAFVASHALLATVAVRLTDRMLERERRRSASATLSVLATAIDEGASADVLLREATSSGALRGIELRWPGVEAHTHGRIGMGAVVRVPLRTGGSLHGWTEPPGAEVTRPLADLLLLYFAVTGSAVIVLGFVALTVLVVRPIERATRAADRLASGRRHEPLPERGARETVALSRAFNAMAEQLRADRQALEARVAELERTTAELRAAREQVLRSERLASVGRLAAGVAHEIGNPLAAILGLVELVREGGLSEAERAEFLGRIQRETERIQKTIRGLLDFARRGQGSSAATPRSTSDLSRIVEEAARLLAPQKDLRGVTLERRLAEHAHVRGDPDALAQLVLNLLLNAADAVRGRGHILVEVEPDERGDWIRLAVTDSGPGIAPEVMGSLFEPFVTTKPPGEGTGLGLAVCHTIVERHGGRISARNVPGSGACFEVWLPAAGPEARTSDANDQK